MPWVSGMGRWDVAGCAQWSLLLPRAPAELCQAVVCRGCHGVKPGGEEEGWWCLVCFVQGAELALLLQQP